MSRPVPRDQTQVAHILAGMLGATKVQGYFDVMPFEDMTEEQMAYHLRHMHRVPASSVEGREALIRKHEVALYPKITHAHRRFE